MPTGEDLKEALIQIKMIAMMARAVLLELDCMHAVMPIADPTQYRTQMGAIDESERLVRAFIAFRRTVGLLSGET